MIAYSPALCQCYFPSFAWSSLKKSKTLCVAGYGTEVCRNMSRSFSFMLGNIMYFTLELVICLCYSNLNLTKKLLALLIKFVTQRESCATRRKSMKLQTSSEKIDLFKNTFRASMPLTDDYVFHAVFGRDTEESRAALIEILIQYNTCKRKGCFYYQCWERNIQKNRGFWDRFYIQ